MTQIILGGLVVLNAILLLVLNHHTREIKKLEESLTAFAVALRRSLESQQMLVAATHKLTNIVHEREHLDVPMPSKTLN